MPLAYIIIALAYVACLKVISMNVMITGASGGLGRVLADECARRGYNLFLTDINSEKLNLFRISMIRQYKVNVLAMACDLICEKSFHRLMEFIDSHNLRFDMLLNVAGIDHEGAFMATESSKLQSIIDLDVTSTIRMTHAILQRRQSNRDFYLLFVSSLASFFPMPLKATYAASKRFLLDFSCALRQELKSQKVQILTLCPAGLATTNGTLQAIIAQGLWGQLTTNRLEHISRKTINRLTNGKKTYIPGLINRVMKTIGCLIPRSWLAAMIFSRWGNTQSKWMKTSLNENSTPHIIFQDLSHTNQITY